MTKPKTWDWKRIVSTVLFVVLIVLLCVYVYFHWEDMQRLLRLEPKFILMALVFALAGCNMNCIYHRMLLDTYQIPLGLVDWMGVVYVSNAIAYVLPMRADLVFSAAYYKRTKGLQYVKSVSMAAGNIVFGMIFALLQMLVSLLCTGFIDGLWSLTLWLVWSAAAIATAAVVVVSLLFENRELKILQKYKLLRDVKDGFIALLRNRPLLLRLLACLALNAVFQLGLYVVCFHAISIPITIYQALFYSSISWIATIVAIVPGNIGIKEAVMGVATSQMGVLFQNGVAVSLLQRVSVMVVYVVMGLVFAYPVWRRWNRGGTLKQGNESDPTSP